VLPRSGFNLDNFLSDQNNLRIFVKYLALLLDNMLASSSDDKTIKIWDTVSGKSLKTLNDSNGTVNSLVVLPDYRLASGSSDKTIKIWDKNSRIKLINIQIRSYFLFLSVCHMLNIVYLA
jgi:WD40 repeat protein